jgi:hypothetical protein
MDSGPTPAVKQVLAGSQHYKLPVNWQFSFGYWGLSKAIADFKNESLSNINNAGQGKPMLDRNH